MAKLEAWRPPGFSAFVGPPIAAEDKAALEDIAAYLLRPPLSLEKLVYGAYANRTRGAKGWRENKPPTAPREIRAVPVDDEGREIAEPG